MTSRAIERRRFLMESPEQKVIISIESTKNELESFIKSIEAAIDSLSIKECFPHVQNL